MYITPEEHTANMETVLDALHNTGLKFEVALYSLHSALSNMFSYASMELMTEEQKLEANVRLSKAYNGIAKALEDNTLSINEDFAVVHALLAEGIESVMTEMEAEEILPIESKEEPNEE